jgi:DNA-binding transcriptional regulator YiaG
MQGCFESGDDIAALRSFVGMTQDEFARAVGISVHILRNWEQGRLINDNYFCRINDN